jgi:hypothetical protein
METPLPNKELSALSASKVKTLENCSWLYWCNYHLKVPQAKNEGAKKGDVCHLIFEILLNPKYKPRVEKIVAAKTLRSDPAVFRLLKLFIRRGELPLHESIIKQIDEMIVVGLGADFYVKGGKVISPEYKFDITTADFRVKGFIDKPAKRGNILVIDDFKSSKQKFVGEEEESNLQAMFYSWAGRRLFPGLTPIVRFIFLQFPEDPIMTVKFTDDVLNGFEHYLSDVQKRVNYFNLTTATSSFAADKKPDGDGFNGSRLCGFAKHPDQKKKDGTKMWHCAYRFAYDYYAVKKDGKIVYTVLTEAELKPLKEGEVVSKEHYAGCPKHRNHIGTFTENSVKKAPKKYVNAFDDFL